MLRHQTATLRGGVRPAHSYRAIAEGETFFFLLQNNYSSDSPRRSLGTIFGEPKSALFPDLEYSKKRELSLLCRGRDTTLPIKAGPISLDSVR